MDQEQNKNKGFVIEKFSPTWWLLLAVIFGIPLIRIIIKMIG